MQFPGVDSSVCRILLEDLGFSSLSKGIWFGLLLEGERDRTDSGSGGMMPFEGEGVPGLEGFKGETSFD